MTAADHQSGSPLPRDSAERYQDVDAEARLAVPTPVRTDAPGVPFVTGMPGAGKTTVARSLARSFARGAHVEEDWVWWWLTMSGAAGTGEDEEFKRERQPSLHAAPGFARGQLRAGGVLPIVDGAIMRRSWLRDRLSHVETRRVFLVVLAPDDATTRSRDAERSGVTFYDE
jgi:predicted kinase